ncbi:hypothetical protein [Paraburkholderia caribensis]|uniref:hypothetical protein n=1 Tax=Paraburkholderia caribensis TaxID=75105 RepID=UPI0034D1FDB3
MSALRLLESTELPTESEAISAGLEDAHLDVRLPPAINFSASELLEALFFEDAKPVVVFDAPNPELIALRLLAALWPDIRRRFSLSTFALSPRKIGGRDLDLVFAPSNAKSKFSDWPGRRVDGRATQADRHRWTGTIVRRVFASPDPRLLSDYDVKLLGDRETESAASLRIALLWDELLEKLGRTPTAALGLLDIAHSGLVSNTYAMRALEPRLADVIRTAPESLSPSEAWEFIGAISKKIRGRELPQSRRAVEELVALLAERAPEGAIKLLHHGDRGDAIEELIPHIAMGLSLGAMPRVEQMLLAAPADVFAMLASQGGALASRIAQCDNLIERVPNVLKDIEHSLAARASAALQPFLVDDRQLTAALPIFATLTTREVAKQLERIGQANAFGAKCMCAVLIKRARDVGGLSTVREVLVSCEPSDRRDELLGQTIEPEAGDVRWLLGEKNLSVPTVTKLLVDLLSNASDRKFCELFEDEAIAERVLDRLPQDAVDLLVRIAFLDGLPVSTYVGVVQSIIPKVDDIKKFDIARRAIEPCLRNRFVGDEGAVLYMLLDILGAWLDGAWAARAGLDRENDPALISRNLVAFNEAPQDARARILSAVDEVARILQGRYSLDIDEAASDACANLMLDAERTEFQTVLAAAGWLVPSLLSARHQRVSSMIAALFPLIYRELAKESDVPDMIKFVPFVDWDRCKTARRELVHAFMTSSWRPGDLALTACRCNDVKKIFKRVAASYGGDEYLASIENDLGRLGTDDRDTVKHAIAEIRMDSSYRFDW